MKRINLFLLSLALASTTMFAQNPKISIFCDHIEEIVKQEGISFREAASKLKAKDFKGAVTAALKSNEYLESATAYKIAGTASNALKDIPAAEKYLSKYLELAPDAKDAEQIKAAVAALRAALKK